MQPHLSHPHLSHPKYRADIDGLRAIAVLSVVAFHAFPAWMKGGFIGVDIFFVISGYLISTIIFENLNKGTFSFAEFYARRIKRIFPALILVLAACYIFGWFALLADEKQQLGKHIAASAGFISNIVLWNEAGYFDNASQTKPLLHLWSLGIEEQFYIIWPLLLWLAWKRKFSFLTVTIVVAAVSFYLNIKGVKKDPTATFYSPQTRFWELLCGSLLAWVTLYKKGASGFIKAKLAGGLFSGVQQEKQEIDTKILSNVLSFLGIFILAYGFWRINQRFSFPGRWAIAPVLGAVLIISAGQGAWFNRNILSNKLAVWFGLISFPLYLWHWPLLSFARIIESELPGREIRIAAVLLSVALAWLTYRFVERPVRLGKNSQVKVFVLVLLMIAIGCMGYGSFTNKQDSRNPSKLSTEKSIAEAEGNCELVFPDWTAITNNPCRLQRKTHNTIAIVGDSHAGQLFVGLSELMAPNQGVAVFSASCAAPYINVSTALNNVKARKHRVGAYKLINHTYDYIINDPSIKIVVLAHHPECSFGDAVDMTNLDNKDYREVLTQGMERTFSALIKANKQVLVLFDNPSFDYDPKLCEVRLFRLTAHKDRCSFSRKQFEHNPAFSGYRSLVETVLKDYPQVKTFDLSKPLCDSKSCYIYKNGHVIYADNNHLNWDGSRYVAPYLLDVIKTMK